MLKEVTCSVPTRYVSACSAGVWSSNHFSYDTFLCGYSFLALAQVFVVPIEFVLWSPLAIFAAKV
jgi:hypothetical protein